MHKFLRAVGFSKIKDRKELTSLITSSIQNAQKRNYVTNNENMILAEFARDYADGIGIAVCGEFDDDDNYVCVFAKDFQIDQDDIDEDFIEVYWKREKLSPVELLEGCSYYDSLKDEVGKIQDRNKTYNCFALFYDYEYTGAVCESPSGLTYLGVFEYEK